MTEQLPTPDLPEKRPNIFTPVELYSPLRTVEFNLLSDIRGISTKCFSMMTGNGRVKMRLGFPRALRGELLFN